MPSSVSITVREDLDARALAVLPGGTTRGLTSMFPLAPRAVSGSGYQVRGEEGQTWIDLNNNFTSLIHGHAHPAIVEAAARALRDGPSFGMSTRHEIELAELLVKRIPSAEQVRFTNSGTEAVMTCLRAARGVTGKSKTVFLSPSYHGSSDHALVALGPTYMRGVTAGSEDDVLTIAPGDTAALRAAFAGSGADIAAVVLDLVPARAGARPLEPDYVHEVRKLTRQHGALLVADEVVTLRHGYGGMAADVFGIVPDLTAVGKIIGGGLPVGAIVGAKDVMSALDPRSHLPVFHGGTFSGNPVTMQAGLVAMELYSPEEVTRVARLGDRLREMLRPQAQDLGLDVTGHGSSVRLVPLGEEQGPGAWRDDLWRAAEAHGLLLIPGQISACLSTPMNDRVVDEIAERLIDAMRSVPPIDASVRDGQGGDR